MRLLPLIATPSPYPLLALDDAEIALVAARIERSEIIIYLQVLTEDLEGEEEAHARAIDDWAAAGSHGHPPDDPAERRFKRLDVNVSDDTGQSYPWRRSAIGGSGHLVRGEWHFAGDLPDRARYLVVSATDLGGRDGSCRIAV